MKQYVLSNPKAKCKAHYRKGTILEKSHGKTVRVVGCLYVAPSSPPVTSTATSTVTTSATTTTIGQINNQATTTTFLSASSIIKVQGSPGSQTWTATLVASVTVAGGSATPGAGTVTFTSDGQTICVGKLLSTSFATCSSSAPFAFDPSVVTATFSGTDSGIDDGHGGSYAGSQGSAATGD